MKRTINRRLTDERRFFRSGTDKSSETFEIIGAAIDADPSNTNTISFPKNNLRKSAQICGLNIL
jgi:hypothetical protein